MVNKKQLFLPTIACKSQLKHSFWKKKSSKLLIPRHVSTAKSPTPGMTGYYQFLDQQNNKPKKTKRNEEKKCVHVTSSRISYLITCNGQLRFTFPHTAHVLSDRRAHGYVLQTTLTNSRISFSFAYRNFVLLSIVCRYIGLASHRTLTATLPPPTQAIRQVYVNRLFLETFIWQIKAAPRIFGVCVCVTALIYYRQWWW